MSPALGQVAELIRRETGIDVKESQLTSLTAALARIAPGMDAQRFLLESADPVAGGGLIGRLIDEVTVQESYFFREVAELRSLDWRELLEVARAGGGDSVRVWVAACATGEEAYTLAILATEAFWPDPPPVSILATDVSSAAIEAAARGVFSERSLRNVPSELASRYFTPKGRGLGVREDLKRLVRFRRHNLSRDPYPPAGEVQFEAIACRNVLIYLGAAEIEKALAGMESALRPGGRLILGAADRLTRVAKDLGPGSRSVPRAPAAPRRPSAPSRIRRGAERRRIRGRKAVPRAAAPERGGIEAALAAADGGDLEAALEISGRVIAEEPLDADACFVHGLAALASGSAEQAVASFRRALYVDPSFALAAFQLGRAFDSIGDGGAARRAYEQALRSFDPNDRRHELILDQVDVGDLAAACRARLGASLATGSAGP